MAQALAYEARKRMVERLKAAHLPKQTRQDSDNDAPSRNSREARQRLLARVAGRSYSPPAKGTYREDSPDTDRLAWYRAHLRSEGYTSSTIGRMLQCP
jgi:hypothetical protein